MVYAIQTGRKNRTLGEMALHVLEIAHGVHESSKNGTHYEMETTFERPDALPIGLKEFSDEF